MNQKLHDELESFRDQFKGGYFEGDPLNPLATSGYRHLGYISTLHATFLRCIKPYLNGETVTLEIGPGRGAWTKALLPSKAVYALDALSAEHNQFHDYVGHPPNVKYFHVQDFECGMLPDDHFDYMFSYGCLCHVSFDGIQAYAANLYPKLKSAANCFWMVADYEKYDRTVQSLDEFSIYSALMSRLPRYSPLRGFLWFLMKSEKIHLVANNDKDVPGRWHNAGTDRTCSMLEQTGYRIVDRDVGTCTRDPVIHFVKP